MPTVIFSRPRIALIDINAETTKSLEKRGYQATTASFGKRFEVSKSKGYFPLEMTKMTSSLAEEEVVIVDLRLLTPEKKALSSPRPVEGINEFWADMSLGLIDPRPFQMLFVRDDMNRILANGGVFLAFIDIRLEYDYAYGHLEYGTQLARTGGQKASTWGILRLLETGEFIEVTHDEGTHIDVSTDSPLGKLLKKHIHGAKFHCTIKRNYNLAPQNWAPLAINKFGGCVGAVIQAGKGMVVLVPDLADKGAFITEFVADYLPDARPDLFPDSAGKSWIHETPYESTKILDIQTQATVVQNQAAAQLDFLTQQISVLREDNRLEYGLLTETGDALVECVISALQRLGFAEVIDADKVASEQGKSNLAEDIQVLDSDPILLCEVKGIGGMPSDDDILSANKYLAIRMKEWNKTNIKALSVINHQRNIPALQRNDNLIRDEIKENVIANGIGVITTFDLFRLLRSKEKLNWDAKHTRPIFLRDGRIDPIPAHYDYLGRVTKFMNNICGVTVEANSFSKGDSLVFELQMEFVEESPGEVQVENKVVGAVKTGQTFGFETGLTKAETMGVRVFRISKS